VYDVISEVKAVVASEVKAFVAIVTLGMVQLATGQPAIDTGGFQSEGLNICAPTPIHSVHARLHARPAAAPW
jgi:hypothetical protein